MRSCEHCGCEVGADVTKCPHCLRWSEEVLVRLLQHSDAGVREQACFDAVFVQRSPRLIRGLAAALRDPFIAVRQQAGIALFLCGPAAEGAVPELIEALCDSDLKVRRVAAAALSLVGPPARAALPRLARLRDAEDELLRFWVREAERSIGAS